MRWMLWIFSSCTDEVSRQGLKIFFFVDWFELIGVWDRGKTQFTAVAAIRLASICYDALYNWTHSTIKPELQIVCFLLKSLGTAKNQSNYVLSKTSLIAVWRPQLKKFFAKSCFDGHVATLTFLPIPIKVNQWHRYFYLCGFYFYFQGGNLLFALFHRQLTFPRFFAHTSLVNVAFLA